MNQHLQSHYKILMFSQLLLPLYCFISEMAVCECCRTAAIPYWSTKQHVQKSLCYNLLTTITVLAMNHLLHIHKICWILVSRWLQEASLPWSWRKAADNSLTRPLCFAHSRQAKRHSAAVCRMPPLSGRAVGEAEAAKRVLTSRTTQLLCLLLTLRAFNYCI